MNDERPELRDDGILAGPDEALDAPLEPPFKSPVKPVQLGPNDKIRFACHKGVACFNECCKNIDIQLTPYDILRLKRRLGLSSSEFVARYTLPFEMDGHGMPGLKLATQPGTTACVFLTEAGCGVYEDRPAACRYYALGAMGVRKMGEAQVEDVYYLVQETHCLGHQEDREITVDAYRREQGVDVYDDMNREWRDIIIKKRSSGPTVGQPTARSMQLFDMCSYDLDGFRDFIQTEGFRDVFDLSDDEIAALAADDEALMQFAFRFLKQALYGEMTIPVKAGAKERRLARRKALRARHSARTARPEPEA